MPGGFFNLYGPDEPRHIIKIMRNDTNDLRLSKLQVRAIKEALKDVPDLLIMKYDLNESPPVPDSDELFLHQY